MRGALQLSLGENSLSDVDQNKLGTAPLKLHQAEDRMVKALQTLLRLDPDSKQQLNEYISPRIEARLHTDDSDVSSLLDLGQELDLAEDSRVGDTLIPFTYT